MAIRASQSIVHRELASRTTTSTSRWIGSPKAASHNPSLFPSFFWDFGSLYYRRCGVPAASCCGSDHLRQKTLRRLW